MFVDVARCAKHRASSENGWTRVIVEKPFGRDTESSRELTRGLKQYLSEDQIFRYVILCILVPWDRFQATHTCVHTQIFNLVNLFYRIDHHLGEELVENLLVLRFSNLVFQPLWSRNYIRNVQLIFSEDFGAEGRGRLVQYLLFFYSTQIISFLLVQPQNLSYSYRYKYCLNALAFCTGTLITMVSSGI